jgi:hypothetical protein
MHLQGREDSRLNIGAVKLYQDVIDFGKPVSRTIEKDIILCALYIEL